MKKRKVELDKKLFLDKGTIAALNANQQTAVLGGDLYTDREYCVYTRYQTNCNKCPANTLEGPGGQCN